MHPQNDLEARARELYRNRLCPHCGKKISLWEALSMVIGSALHYSVKVRLPSGKVVIRPWDKINPQNSVILEHD
ncbi:MAG: hypothetical protein WDO73_03010 [Ignavibacteriota bacterium]